MDFSSYMRQVQRLNDTARSHPDPRVRDAADREAQALREDYDRQKERRS
ncbi:hypothetical protein [Actinomadura kijaniata]|nr:hypothetical protein [Actinomadura kijaniata]